MMQTEVLQAMQDRRSCRAYLPEQIKPEELDAVLTAGTWAPTVLVVLADKSRHTCVEDGSLVMGNLLLAAHAAGLGACWIHRAREVFAGDEGKALLAKWGLDAEKYIGVGHCILGYAAPGGYREAAPRKADYVVRV